MLLSPQSLMYCKNPAGQAFAKHYNPLLSGETSYGSQHSSDKQSSAVMFRRFGEQMQTQSPASGPSCMTGESIQTPSHAVSSRYSAPASQAMHTGDITSKLDEGSQQQQHDKPNMNVKHQTTEPVPAARQDAEQTHKQSSLGKQLSDALGLRRWTGRQSHPSATALPDLTSSPANQANPSQPAQPAQTHAAVILSPRAESALMVAASEVGFGAGLDNAPMQPALQASRTPAEPTADAALPARYCLPSANMLCSLVTSLHLWSSLTTEITCNFLHNPRQRMLWMQVRTGGVLAASCREWSIPVCSLSDNAAGDDRQGSLLQS